MEIRERIQAYFLVIYFCLLLRQSLFYVPSLLVVADLKGGKYESKNVEEIR